MAEHQFCRDCGIHSVSRPRSHPSDYDVNGRCLDAGIDMFEITPFDGQHWVQNVDAIRWDMANVTYCADETAAYDDDENWHP